MVELAKQSLTAVADGGAEPFRAGVAVMDEDLVLDVGGAVAGVTLRLDLDHPSGHRWRGHWLLELTQGDEKWVLSVDTPEAAISDARRGPILVKPRLRHRALARELAGAVESIPISDVACHRYTRQSTALPDPAGFAPWMVPTTAEAAPWWELDLGKSLYVAWSRIDLVAPPPGTRVVVRAYAFLSPTLEPPGDSIVFEARAEQLAAHAGRVALAIGNDVVARYLRVELISEGAPVSLAITAAEVLASELQAETLLATLRRSFALFTSRPLFITRTGEPIATYGEIWARTQAFARGLAQRIEPIVDREGTPENLRGRAVLTITTRSRIEWLLADLAGLIRGYVTVPLSPDEPDDRLAHVLSRAPATCIVCEAADADRMARLAPQAWIIACDRDFAAVEEAGATAEVPEPTPRAPGDLYSVLFTSGSTGAPKGAMRTYATFFAMVGHYQVGHSPRHLSFQPLSHMSERSYLPSLIIHGGSLAFSRGGAHLLEDLKELGPTTLGSVPRLFEVLHAQYRRRLRALIAAEPAASRGELEKRALEEARGAFGPRLSAISIGSAPVTPEVFGFLKRCFHDLWVSEGYGSTEVGTIATDGKISDDAQVKLVPVPGAEVTPGRERGEIWVKSPHAIEGYLGDAEATRAAFDSEGYFATGDLGERDGDGRVRVVGRLRNTVKLAQGEFVSAERIETALASCPLVDRIFVHAASGAIGVSALVAPHADALARALAMDDADLAALVARPEATQVVLGALRAQAKIAGLATYEIPRGVLLEAAPFTPSSGLITGNGKLARGTLAQRYGAQLAALIAGPAEDGIETEPDDDVADLRTRVVRVASRAIGRSLAIDESLATAGVDSLASAEILAALSDELGRDVPLAWWFEARTLGDLAERLARFADTAKPVTLRERAAVDLALPAFTATKPWSRPTHVLVTGATGFLGAHLVEALVGRGFDVTCIVRAPDDARARERFDAALADRELAPDRARVRVFAGDLAAPQLGLAPAALDPIDGVVHAGATVSWLASYEALREPNVLGTRTVLELAAQRGWALHHVSTISTAPADGDEDRMLTFDAALASTPYGLSKWIAEQHVKQSGVPHTITRPAMIAGHTRTGIGNRDDFTNRYLAGCLDLGLYIDRDDAVMDMTPVDFVAAAIAALVGEPAERHTYHLANVDQSLTFAAIGRAMVAAGHPVRPASYTEFRVALHRAKHSRLHALAAFFPETFALGAGPFPCARSVGELAELGVLRPKIDETLIARYVARLR
jgi:fatty acid CoA ligase FadD9